ncbi:MAG: hypothetical protein B0D91_00710 [Oceanospirillales bacterium LUC14_002_19_P2]|nr:MAG: hypothetical protein B0D91_00710 [Oceanospirillales bacterium LUC14_002_19_P2]
MTIQMKVSGQGREISELRLNIGGTTKEVTRVLMNRDGVTHEVYESGYSYLGYLTAANVGNVGGHSNSYGFRDLGSTVHGSLNPRLGKGKLKLDAFNFAETAGFSATAEIIFSSNGLVSSKFIENFNALSAIIYDGVVFNLSAYRGYFSFIDANTRVRMYVKRISSTHPLYQSCKALKGRLSAGVNASKLLQIY